MTKLVGLFHVDFFSTFLGVYVTSPQSASVYVKFDVRHRFLAPAILMAIAAVFGRPVDMSAQGRSSGIKSGSHAMPSPTPAGERLASFKRKTKALEASPLRNAPVRSIGPSIMGGRVAAIEVSPDDPATFYVGYATGGLWKTTSNGTAFRPLSEHQPAVSIGDVAVRWGRKDVIYVGTGEGNAIWSSVPGAGVYRSRDDGKHWDYLGLAETHTIGKVVLSPADTNVIYVAAIGHLYSKNRERGVFKTTDGGNTWRPTLQIDDSTGVVDLVMHPDDPNILYAAAWHRIRRSWDFVESGRSSGIYKSEDAGETWELVSTAKSGFPTGRHVGRIGLGISASSTATLYAVVDNQSTIESGKDLPNLTFDALRRMGAETFLNDVGDEDLEEFLSHYDFPDEFGVGEVRRLIKSGKAGPSDLASWVGESKRLHYDSEVVGCEVYRSNDDGAHWWRTNEKPLRDVCHSYGYYFGDVTVDPTNPDRVYLGAVPLLKSEDGGETFESIGGENVHVDHHALWINPKRPGHLLDGNDGGLNLSYDGGETWFKLNTPPVGQFNTVNYDYAEPYNVYGGLQDNGVWYGPSDYRASVSWHEEGGYPYHRLLGGDGMMVEVSAQNENVVFAGKQFGHYYLIFKELPGAISIRPHHALGDEPLRFNWLTPIHLSTHSDRILYLGSQKVHRSMDAGDTWQVLSDDLSLGERDGDTPFGTLTALEESPLRFGVLYAGTDDGLVHRSKDSGASWESITAGLPHDMWVSRIEPSIHSPGRVYLSLNGSRSDNMNAMVYASENFGDTWLKIGSDLPLEPVNVIREDPINEDILYVGSDGGLYVSLDRGREFLPAFRDLPGVPVRDLAVHPRDQEILIGTHGRSIFAGDVSLIQRLDEELMDSPVFAFEIDTVWFDQNWGDSDPAWEDPDMPSVTIPFWTGETGRAVISVVDEYGNVMISTEHSVERGLNYVENGLCIGEARMEAHLHARKKHGTPVRASLAEPRDNGLRFLLPGSYEVQVRLNFNMSTTRLVVVE